MFEDVLEYFAGRGDGRYTIIVRNGEVVEIKVVPAPCGEQATLYESPRQAEERQQDRALRPKLPLPPIIWDDPLDDEGIEHLLELEAEYGE